MIAFYASQPQYVEHLAPIAAALGPDVSGWHVTSGMARHIAAIGGQIRPRRPQPGSVVVCAGGGELVRLGPHSTPVLVEHGCGQAYPGLDVPNYSGGAGRERVALFLVPNPKTGFRNLERYPDTPAVVVGSPRLDALASALAGTCHDGGGSIGPTTVHGNRPDPPAVAFTFHWDMRSPVPETRWALPHYEDALPSVVSQMRSLGLDVLGHGHPRYRLHFARLWRALGVEYVPRFEDVVRRASVLVADNTSALFEAAALGVPVVVLNAPWYRRDSDAWPRFWSCADVGLQVDEPGDLFDAILSTLADDPQAARRAAVVDEVFPLRDGRAADRAADAIRAITTHVARHGIR